MNIPIVNSLSTGFPFFQYNILSPLNFKQKKTVIIALVALSFLAVRFLYYSCCLKVKKVIHLKGEGKVDNLQDQGKKEGPGVLFPLVKPKTPELVQQPLDGQLEQEQAKIEMVPLIEPFRIRIESLALKRRGKSCLNKANIQKQTLNLKNL